MNLTRKPLLLVAAGICGLAAAGAFAKQLTLDEVPPEVRKTIDQYAAGAKINEVELEKEDGKLVYDVEIVRDGKEVDFMVSPEGKYLGEEAEDGDQGEHGEHKAMSKHDDDDDEHEGDYEDDDEGEEEVVTMEQLPAAVRVVADTLAAEGKITEITREREDDATVYEIEYVEGGEKASVEVAETGEIMEAERAIAAAELPAAVRAELEEEFPGATFGEISAVQVFYYEIEVIGEHGKREVKLLATGEEVDED